MKNRFKKIIIWLLTLGISFQAIPVSALTKDETAYAKLDTYGKPISITVSNHLYDFEGESIKDNSKLDNIKNLVDGKKVQKGDIVWKTNNNDVYYQGTVDSLPIDITIKYYLNGREMSIKDMLGKKGNVKIEMQFKNKLSYYVKVNGINQLLYTPFVIATTTNINNTYNSNISVDNGKVIDNGLSSTIIAINSPGLYESLDLEALKDLDKLSISYDTTNFKLDAIYSIATSKLLEKDDLNIFKKFDSLYNDMDSLQDGMNTIVDASNLINDKTKLLADGTNELNENVQKIANKYKNYRDKNNLKNELKDLIEKNLYKVLPELQKDISNEVNDIVHQNKDDIKKSVVDLTKKNTELIIKREIDNFINNYDFDQLVNELIKNAVVSVLVNDAYVNEIANILETELKSEINNEIKNIIKDEVNKTNKPSANDDYINNIASTYSISYDDAKKIIEKVQNDSYNEIINNLNNSSEDISLEIINSLTSRKTINKISNTYIKEVSKKIMIAMMSNPELINYRNELKNKLIEAIIKSLGEDEIYSRYDEINNYINGLIDTIITNTADDLAEKYTEDYTIEVVNNILDKQFSEDNIETNLNKILDEYEKELDDKIALVDDTVNKMSDSIQLLNDGTHLLSSGINEFNQGINRFNLEGISKLTNFVNNDLRYFEGKVKALINLSNNYQTIDNNTNGSSKIIFMIDAVEKKEVQIKKKTVQKNKTIWQKIKYLFS